MLKLIQFDLADLDKSIQYEEQFPLQEKIANPVTFRVERSMTEILTERLVEAGALLAAPVFIP